MFRQDVSTLTDTSCSSDCTLTFYTTGTGIFQPADVGLQRVIKHQLKQHALDFQVQSHTEMLDSGLSAEEVRFTQSLPVLRDNSVGAIVKVWQFLSTGRGPEIIQKVFCSIDGAVF